MQIVGLVRTWDTISMNGASPEPERATHHADPQADEYGHIADPREEKQPWRQRYKYQQCTGVRPDGSRCEVKVRGSDRCPEHKRECKGKNRKSRPCGSPPLRGFEWCFSHMPDPVPEPVYGPYEEPGPWRRVEPDDERVHGALLPLVHSESGAVAPRWGSPELAREAGKLGGAARRYPRLTEQLQQAIEDRAEAIVGAGIGALDATRGVVVEHTSFDDKGRRVTEQEVVDYPDHLVRLKAHEALTNRAFGRPHQAVDVSQESRSFSVSIDATDPEVRKDLHSFLRRRPGVDV